MGEKTWHAVQRRICKRLGVEHVGHLGVEGPDGEDEALVVEVKHRSKELPKYLAEPVEKIQAEAGDDRIGIVVIHTKYGRHDDDLVIMTLKTFEDWRDKDEEAE